MGGGGAGELFASSPLLEKNTIILNACQLLSSSQVLHPHSKTTYNSKLYFFKALCFRRGGVLGYQQAPI